MGSALAARHYVAQQLHAKAWALFLLSFVSSAFLAPESSTLANT